MQESPFPVQRSLLSASALAGRVRTKYSLPGPPTCRFWRRSINDLYLIEAGGTKLVLRICPTGWRSYEHLAAEIDLLLFLQQKQIPVAEPVAQRDGEYIQTLHAPEGPRYGVVFSYLSGKPLQPGHGESYRYGQALAQLHRVTDDYPAGRAGFHFDPANMVDEPLERLEPLFAHRRDDWDYLLEVLASLKPAASKLPRQAPQYGLCHGDVNDGNLLLGRHDQWALLDFEYFGYGWRVFDIGTFINNQVYQLGRTEQTERILAAFLDGYQSVRPLSQSELESLPAFVLLRQVWLLGRGAKFLPNMGLSPFEEWAFERCMPLIREWMATPWRPVGKSTQGRTQPEARRQLPKEQRGGTHERV